MQDEAIRLFTRLVGEAPSRQTCSTMRIVIATSSSASAGFPTATNILGRQSTAEEIAFLRQPGSGF